MILIFQFPAAFIVLAVNTSMIPDSDTFIPSGLNLAHKK
jgi:hypothetical protein